MCCTMSPLSLFFVFNTVSTTTTQWLAECRRRNLGWSSCSRPASCLQSLRLQEVVSELPTHRSKRVGDWHCLLGPLPHEGVSARIPRRERRSCVTGRVSSPRSGVGSQGSAAAGRWPPAQPGQHQSDSVPDANCGMLTASGPVSSSLRRLLWGATRAA